MAQATTNTALAKTDGGNGLLAMKRAWPNEQAGRHKQAAEVVRDYDPERIEGLESRLYATRKRLWAAQRRSENAKAPEARQAAEEALRAAQAEADAVLQEVQEADGITSLLVAYLFRHGRRPSDCTVKAYRASVRLLARWAADQGVKVHRMTEDLAGDFVAYLVEQGCAPATVRARVAACSTLHRALSWCGLHKATGPERIEPSNPWQHVQPERAPSRAESVKYYDREDLASLIAQAERDLAEAEEDLAKAKREGARVEWCEERLRSCRRLLPLIYLGSQGGLRIAESSAVCWGDLDFRATKKYPHGRLEVREGKGRKARTVGMTAELAEVLKWYRRYARADEPILAVKPRRLEDQLQRLAARAGVQHHGTHGLRHSCGVFMAEEEPNLAVTRDHLGHSSTATTEVYATVLGARYAGAVSKFGAAMTFSPKVLSRPEV